MRAVIYTYTGRQNAQARDRQHDACQETVRAAEMPVTAWVHDERGDRSGLARVHDLAQHGDIDAVIVWRLDRFGRNPATLCAHLVTLDAASVRIVTADRRPTGLAQAIPDVMRVVADPGLAGRVPSSAPAPVPGVRVPGA